VNTQCYSLGALDSVNYYKVESVAVCGSGQYQVERKQEAWVKE